MKLVRWKRFTWDLSKLPPLETAALPEHYRVRSATREEVKTVKEVVFSAFSLDSAWSDTFKIFRDQLDANIELAFGPGALPPLVVTHGQRIIAVSSLLADVAADSHLTSGPCVRMEYRNRGIGTALLLHSLLALQQAGLARASAISKDSSATTKFVYPKFGSTSEACDFEPSPVSS
jgi:predicted N-acetyltransferase YhbS